MPQHRIKVLTPNGKKELQQASNEILKFASYIGPKTSKTNWQTRIRTKLKNAIRLPLPGESEIIQEAENFVSRELVSLGHRNFPTICAPIREDYGSNKGSANTQRGLAFADFRGALVKPTNLELSRELVCGTTVHEITHLSGKVQLGKDAWISMGLLILGKSKHRFALLEEFVTVSMQGRYLKAKGWQEKRKNINFAIKNEERTPQLCLLAIVIAQVYKQQSVQEHFQRKGLSLADFNWDKPLHSAVLKFSKDRSANILPGSISIPSFFWAKDGIVDSNGYQIAIPSIQDLAEEVCKSYATKGNRALAFENRMINYHQEGDVRGAVRYMCGAVGPTAKTILALLHPTLKTNCCETFINNLLLRLYVDAGNLPDKKLKGQVRAAIAKLVKDRNNLIMEVKI